MHPRLPRTEPPALAHRRWPQAPHASQHAMQAIPCLAHLRVRLARSPRQHVKPMCVPVKTAHRQLLLAAARHSAKRTAKSIVQRAMRVTRSLQQQGRARRPARTQHATARWQLPTVILATARQRWQKALHANQPAMRATQCQARQHAHRWGSRRLRHAHQIRVMRQWPQPTAVLETALRHWPRDPHASPRATQATPCQAPRSAWPEV